MKKTNQCPTPVIPVHVVKGEDHSDIIPKPELWKLLIVDDEDEVHRLTRLALDDFKFDGRGIKLISAKSEEEAKLKILENEDIALILLDVVMETDDAGVRLVRYIREELQNSIVQIILRTGQPGRVPEKETVTGININGYTSKLELTAEKMYSIVASALRAYWLSFSLNRLNDRLKRELEERKRAEDAVRRLTQFQETVIDNANIWLTVLDEKGCVVIWNMAAEKISGYARDDVLGRNDVSEWLYPDHAYREEILNKISTFSAEKDDMEGVETAITRKDGRERVISWDRQDLRDKDNNHIGTIFLGRDVTERRLLENQLRQAQKMEAVGRMAGGLAHDFNNLLTIIKGYCDIGISGLTPEDELFDKIRQIDKAAGRAESLTRQLLSFSRHQMMKLAIINLNSLIMDLKRMLVRLISADIELVTWLDESLQMIRADHGHIEQVIMNLVVNARDAMPKGGILTIGTKNVFLDAKHLVQYSRIKAGDYVCLSVGDNGTGMDEETQERIFEPFFTTKAAGKGTGLGLSTVYGIVSQCKGYIMVESEPGRGTLFKIYFPAVSRKAIRKSQLEEAPAPLNGNETILVVEDQPDVLKFIKEALHMYGYNVLEASNAGGALLICEEYAEEIHLIITDIVMPRMNGVQLVKRLGKMRPDTKVLFISGYAPDIIKENGGVNPVTNFLQKPFKAKGLLRTVRQILDGKN